MIGRWVSRWAQNPVHSLCNLSCILVGRTFLNKTYDYFLVIILNILSSNVINVT